MYIYVCVCVCVCVCEGGLVAGQLEGERPILWSQTPGQEAPIPGPPIYHPQPHGCYCCHQQPLNPAIRGPACRTPQHTHIHTHTYTRMHDHCHQLLKHLHLKSAGMDFLLSAVILGDNGVMYVQVAHTGLCHSGGWLVGVWIMHQPCLWDNHVCPYFSVPHYCTSKEIMHISQSPWIIILLRGLKSPFQHKYVGYALLVEVDM